MTPARPASLPGKWLRLPLPQKLTVIHVLVIASIVEVAIRVAPVSKVSRWLGVTLRPCAEPVDPKETASLPITDGEWRQARLILNVMDHWPFAKSTCLRESLVIGHFLRRHQPALRLGVGKVDGRVATHAWIELGESTIGLNDSFLPFRRLV